MNSSRFTNEDLLAPEPALDWAREMLDWLDLLAECGVEITPELAQLGQRSLVCFRRYQEMIGRKTL